MISSKDDASAAAVMAIQQERGTIIYDGIGSFSWANFDKWHVRKAAGTGAYEIGIPGKVDGTDIMTPTWPEGKLLFTLTSLQHPRFGRVHDYTGNGGLPFVWSYYSIHFKDDAGNDANSNFELAITRAVES